MEINLARENLWTALIVTESELAEKSKEEAEKLVRVIAGLLYITGRDFDEKSQFDILRSLVECLRDPTEIILKASSLRLRRQQVAQNDTDNSDLNNIIERLIQETQQKGKADD